MGVMMGVMRMHVMHMIVHVMHMIVHVMHMHAEVSEAFRACTNPNKLNLGTWSFACAAP